MSRRADDAGGPAGSPSVTDRSLLVVMVVVAPGVGRRTAPRSIVRGMLADRLVDDDGAM